MKEGRLKKVLIRRLLSENKIDIVSVLSSFQYCTNILMGEKLTYFRSVRQLLRSRNAHKTHSELESQMSPVFSFAQCLDIFPLLFQIPIMQNALGDVALKLLRQPE